MVADCEYLEKCPIFARFKVEGAKNIWIEFFCRGSRQEECARKVMKKQGQEPGPTLLPNGTHLPSLK
jgi:hypothetical protein